MISELIIYLMAIVMFVSSTLPMIHNTEILVLPIQQITWLADQTSAMVKGSESELEFNGMGNLAYPQTIEHHNKHLVIFMAAGRSEIHSGLSDD
jgi:hypothetical protein